MEPDPSQPPPERNINQAILAQLAEMTEMLLAQQQTINELQQRQPAQPSEAETGAGSGSTPRVGPTSQGAIDAPPGDAPGDTASHQSGASELPVGSAAQQNTL